MSQKKVPRAKRRELREQGLYEPKARVSRAARAALLRDEETATNARLRAAREAVAEHDENDEAPSAPALATPKRDRTVFVLFGLTAIAGVILWLTQRTPSKPATKIDVGAAAAASSATR